jgi:hypothetical protein
MIQRNHHRRSSYRGDASVVGPFSVPNWAAIGFVLVVLVPLAVVLSAKRIRLESRLTRTLWLAFDAKMAFLQT